ncbi:hypothetical protein Tco_1278229 [Tanacetum coccineum]
MSFRFGIIRGYIYTSISSHGDPLAWAVDFFRLQEPDSPEAAPASPDYVPGPEEPEQAPLSPDYVPGPEYPEYLAPSDEEDTLLVLGSEEDPRRTSGVEEELLRRGAEEGREYLGSEADSVVSPIVDHVPLLREDRAVETRVAATPPPHQHVVPL